MKENLNEVKNNVMAFLKGMASENDANEYLKEAVKIFVTVCKDKDFNKEFRKEDPITPHIEYKKLCELGDGKVKFIKKGLPEFCEDLALGVFNELEYWLEMHCRASRNMPMFDEWKKLQHNFSLWHFETALEDYIVKNKIACIVKSHGEQYIALNCDEILYNMDMFTGWFWLVRKED